jgi:hypothetical protein
MAIAQLLLNNESDPSAICRAVISETQLHFNP